jgi:flagellar secretion chaperone FliS
MYASPFSKPPAARGHFGAMYHQVGIETGVAEASPHRLVSMLFEGFMEALAQARGAMRDGQIETKGRSISRAVLIVEEGLRAGLDLQAGGGLARDLNDLYGYLVLRLTQANVRNDEAALDECQRLVLQLQEAWTSIAPQVRT